MTRSAGIYVRISEDPEGDRFGVTRQKEDCEALALRRGWVVTEVYEDNDTSAFSGRSRPAYSRMLDDIRNGRIDAVLAYHTDRLNRQPVELEHFIDVVDRAGVQVETVKSGDLNLSTASGRTIARILGSIARGEVEQKSERQKRAALQAAQHGKPAGGPRSFGYAKGGMEIETEEADLLRQAYHDLLAGFSLNDLARRLNDRGVTTSRGNRWTSTQLRAVLLRARNAGLRSYHDKVVGPAQWPGIVPEETWQSAVRLLSDPSRRTSPGYGRVYLLSGIARCGTCGETVTSAGTQSTRADGSRRVCYRCRTRQHVARNCGPLDDFITDVLIHRLSKADAVSLLHPTADDETATLRDQKTVLRARMEDAAAMFGRGEIHGPQLTTITTSITNQLDAIEDRLRIASGADALTGLLSAEDIRDGWANLTLSARQAVVKTLMTVTILPETKRGARRFNPDLIGVEWTESSR